ncbi:Protein of unknown function [Bacillus cereus]|nr:Protein of unknown function [Bacillus cereus]
MGSPID